MAWSSAAISATYLAARALDKPMLIGANELRPDRVSSIQWRTSGSFSSGSDGTATNGPARRAGDGFTSMYTYPSSAANTWYYLMKWTTAATFDALVIIGHNFGTIGGLTVTLDVADDDAFSSNLQTIATISPGSSNDRSVALTLKHTGSDPRQYTGVTRARLKVTKGSSHTPQFSELILGRSHQLTYKPDIEYATFNEESSTDESETLTGEVGGVTNYERRKLLEADLTLQDETEATKIKDWWSDCKGGTKPFVWIEEPTTTPSSAMLMMLSEKRAPLNYIDGALQTYRISAREQSPFLLAAEL